MKNIARFLLCVVAIATLASCTKSATEGGSANRLATPEFSANASENSITVSWTAVEGAAYYEVALNEKAPERTDKTVHRFENLEWDTTYTVKLQAIAANAEDSSLVATQEVVIAARVVPVYREWYPQNGSTAIAISDDGRWVVGAFDRQGMILDLTSDEITYVENFEFSDVADTGVAVGCTYESSQSGEAAMYIQGKTVKIENFNKDGVIVRTIENLYDEMGKTLGYREYDVNGNLAYYGEYEYVEGKLKQIAVYDENDVLVRTMVYNEKGEVEIIEAE